MTTFSRDGSFKARVHYAILLYVCERATGVPSYRFRRWVYRRFCRWSIGRHSHIQRGVRPLCLGGVNIGDYCCINHDVTLDGRRGITIGDNVHVAFGARILTLSHDPRSPDFGSVGGPVIVDDYVWIGAWSLVLPGVRLGRGCVIGAGSVVTRDVEPLDIVAGNPARVISQRPDIMSYSIEHAPLLQ